MLVFRAMIKLFHRLTLFCLGMATLALAGCAGSGAGSPGMFGAVSKPKTVLVTDFVASPEVDAIDRGFSARMDRKGSNFPILERKRRTLARVNDEIVATIVAALREAGLEAQSGSEEGLTLNDDAVLVSGRLRAADPASASKKQQIGFGAGHGGVVADMTVSQFSAGGKQQLLVFTAQAPSTRKPAAVNRKQAAARNVAIDAVLAAEGTPAVKLSADTEAQARTLGRAVAEKIIAFAKEQKWQVKTEGAEIAGELGQRVKLPEPKPAQKPMKKPDKPAT